MELELWTSPEVDRTWWGLAYRNAIVFRKVGGALFPLAYTRLLPDADVPVDVAFGRLGGTGLAVMAIEAAFFVPLLAGAAVCAAFLACGRPLDVAAIAGTGVACGGLALYVLALRRAVRDP